MRCRAGFVPGAGFQCLIVDRRSVKGLDHMSIAGLDEQSQRFVERGIDAERLALANDGTVQRIDFCR